MRSSFPFLALALTLGWPAPLYAQAENGAPIASSSAEELFRQGRAAAVTGDFATACARFTASEKLEPAPGTLLNVADCEVHLGSLVAAEEHFRLAASGFPKSDPRRGYVAGRVAEIERRMAHITVHIAPTLPSDARVTRDGQPFERRLVEMVLPANPRSTTFVVSAPGFEDRAFTVPLTDGQSAQITLDVGESSPSAPPILAESPPSVAPARSHPWRTAGFVTAGVGLAGLAGGAITGALALHEASVVKHDCAIPAYTCSASGVSAGSSGQTFATASTIAFIAGAALSATGLVLVFAPGKSNAESHSVGMIPYASPSGGGALTTLTF
jgi:hypothetical protein